MPRIFLGFAVLGSVLLSGGLGYLVGKQGDIAPPGRHLDVRTDPHSASTPGPVDSKLAQRLASKVADTFIAQRGGPGEGGIAFHVTPKPYSSFLCRVDTLYFAEKVVRGRTERNQEYWEDDLKITRLYGVWRLPDEPEGGRTREQECSDFRDFERLIYIDQAGSGIDIERAVTHLSRASAQARKGAVTFDLSCDDTRTGERKACDGLAPLKAFDVRTVGQVRSETHRGDGSTVFQDTVFIRHGEGGCGNEMLDFELRTTGPFLGGDDLLSVNVSRYAVC